MTEKSVNDVPMLPELLEQIPPDPPMASVSLDGAYDTKRHAAIRERGEQAIIPPRKNRERWNERVVGASVRNEVLKACYGLGWRIWKKWSGYHRRSLVSTKTHCFKRLGERVMARKIERQMVELHARVALLNRFTQIGRQTTVPMASVAQPHLGRVCSHVHL